MPLTMPSNYRVLTMARICVEDVVELTTDDFAMYVIDQRHWKRSLAEAGVGRDHQRHLRTAETGRRALTSGASGSR